MTVWNAIDDAPRSSVARRATTKLPLVRKVHDDRGPGRVVELAVTVEVPCEPVSEPSGIARVRREGGRRAGRRGRRREAERRERRAVGHHGDDERGDDRRAGVVRRPQAHDDARCRVRPGDRRRRAVVELLVTVERPREPAIEPSASRDVEAKVAASPAMTTAGAVVNDAVGGGLTVIVCVTVVSAPASVADAQPDRARAEPSRTPR